MYIFSNTTSAIPIDEEQDGATPVICFNEGAIQAMAQAGISNTSTARKMKRVLANLPTLATKYPRSSEMGSDKW